jgi:TonB family protein
MRRIILSTLFLSTALVQAQTSTKGQDLTLEARNNSSNGVSSAVAAATDAALPVTARRVSTGVIFPKLISGPTVTVSAADFATRDLGAQHMIVSFRVDENGQPQNVHLVRSVNQSVDARVLAAVRQYHFEPGTLDDLKVPVDVNLLVNFQQK